uniref:Uncharacterized protein n=1 Tax=Oryza punctata TaxID=4537 RepID=A0A0E0M6H4_ORYPU
MNANLTNKHAAVIQSEINVPKDRENYQQINKDSTSKIQRASTIRFDNENYASVIIPMRLPSTNNVDLSYSTPNMHEDVTSLSAAELKRKRAREWYASLTKEQKDDRNKKRRVSVSWAQGYIDYGLEAAPSAHVAITRGREGSRAT